jgi:hypothetical protein
MITKEDVIKLITEIIDALTWKRVWLLCLLVSTCIFLYVLFENRTTIFNKLIDNQPVETIEIPWKISDASKSSLQEITNQQIIGGVAIIDVNLKKNRKTMKHWYFKDTKMIDVVSQVVSETLPQPFFDNSKRNNDQMLDILANRFLCVPTADTAFAKFAPSISALYPYACQIAVPPYVGEFAGYLTVYLTKQPSVIEQDSIKIEVNRISIELYLRDIQNQNQNKSNR